MGGKPMTIEAHYRENPKTKGSGILCCIPQRGICPNHCEDCFFQSGRSYLEPLEENLPNMPEAADNAPVVVRVNDGNDSNVKRSQVVADTERYRWRFYNTAIPRNLSEFPGPVVLTVNPGGMTDAEVHLLAVPLPRNLMFVRFRVNTWNLPLCDQVVEYYTVGESPVPVVLTFMAYFNSADKIPLDHRGNYLLRKRTLNEYWAVSNSAWRGVMDRYAGNIWVHSCGVEGVVGGPACRHCGNCLREYFATMERVRS